MSVTIWTWPGGVKVIERERVQSHPRAGLDQTWIEYQVKVGRVILSRHERRLDAKAAAEAYVATS